MNNVESFTTLKLEFSRVAWYLGNLLSALLGRQILCVANAEDDSCWSISAVDDRFSNTEVVELIQYVGGDATMIRRCIPPDANSSRSLDMDLCRALLMHVLKLNWEHEFVTNDALWILGHWQEPMKLPEVDANMIFIDSRIIDSRKLMSMDEFIDKLFEEGGTYMELSTLCEVYEQEFGTPLYWMQPYTDRLYNGCYFALVKEGILALPYDCADFEDFERFDRESARLCSYDEMYNLAHEFQQRTTEMQNTFNSILFFLERKEELNHA